MDVNFVAYWADTAIAETLWKVNAALAENFSVELFDKRSIKYSFLSLTLQLHTALVKENNTFWVLSIVTSKLSQYVYCNVLYLWCYYPFLYMVKPLCT